MNDIKGNVRTGQQVKVTCRDCGKAFLSSPEDAWHTWCPTCTSAINRLQMAQEKYARYAETADDDEWYA